jgi:hypothetical protein
MKQLHILFCFLAISLWAQSEGYDEATADRMIISEGTLSGTQPRVAVDRFERSHIVWKDGRDIYYARVGKSGEKLTIDGEGATVAARKIWTVSSALTQPRVAADSTGRAHISIPDSAGIVYARVETDGTLGLATTLRFSAGVTYSHEYRGGDIAIDPKTDLPVIGTLVIRSWPTTINGIPYYKYKEYIYAFRIDADGKISKNEKYAANQEDIGGPRGTFEPPVVAVDAAGDIHVVWKCREVVASEHNGPPEAEDPGSDPNKAQAAKYWEQNIHGVSYKPGDLTLCYSNSSKAKILAGVSWLNIFVPQSLTTIIPLRINTANDVWPGTYTGQPALTVSGKSLHVVWAGRIKVDGDEKKVLLYSRVKTDGYGSGGAAVPAQVGTVERRSRVITTKSAVAPKQTPSATLGDGVVHFAWFDDRDGTAASRIWVGAVNSSTSQPLAAEEKPISLPRSSTDNSLPCIAFRGSKSFKAWTGYDGDPNFSPEADPFKANEPNTIVNLYDNSITLTATYNPYPGGKPCPDDPPITLPGQGDGSEFVQVPISADAGLGGYSIVWQENSDLGVDIALHRGNFDYDVLGLWTHYKKRSEAWEANDAALSMGDGNNATGSRTHLPIPVTTDYTALITDSNFHPAQGVVADGVTPLILRTVLPVGKYLITLENPSDEPHSLAGYIQANGKLKIYDHEGSEWVPWQSGDFELEIPAPLPGTSPRRGIFCLEGIDGSDPAISWSEDAPKVALELRFWKQPVNGEDINITTDEPFAALRFAIAHPPVFLVHGFNASAESWTAKFKEKLENVVGNEFVKVIDYGQENQTVGVLAEILDDLKNRTARYQPEIANAVNEANTDVEIIKTNFVDPATSFISSVTGYLTDAGIFNEEAVKKLTEDKDKFLEKYMGSGDFHSFLGWVKKATYWEKKSNAAAPLDTLAKELSMRLFAYEESIRLKEQWAFSRYDAVGHCQGGVLLRMLCENETKGKVTSYLHERNYGRGRFRRVITIASPHRGSRITAYARLYQEEMLPALAEVKQLPVDMVGAGMGLMFYAGYNGYLEDKWDAFAEDIAGTAPYINKHLPVHPSARFHFISTVIDHEHLLVKRIFGGVGLWNDPNFQATHRLFEQAFPPSTVPGTQHRHSDGLVDWRSHYAGINYKDPANAGMLTSLDELTTPKPEDKWAAHLPPIKLTAIIGEPPGPPGFKDVYDTIKGTFDNPWDAIKTALANLLRKAAADGDWEVSLFGTNSTGTNSEIIAEHIGALLLKPESEGGIPNFGPFVAYDPQGSGAYPNSDPTLAEQETLMRAKLAGSIRFLANQQEAAGGTLLQLLKEVFRSEDARDPNRFTFQLTAHADYPIIGEPRWQAALSNGLLYSEEWTEVEVDPTNPLRATVIVDEGAVGHVILQVAYYSQDAGGNEILVQIEPIVVTSRNLGEVTGLHFREYYPVMHPGASVKLTLEAEFSDGGIGAFVPPAEQGIAWTSSHPDILSIDKLGTITALGPSGDVTITATSAALNTSMEIYVVGQPVEVQLTVPELAYTAGDTINLEALVDDPTGKVTAVTFHASSLAIGQSSDPQSPYSIAWADIPAGDHELFAVAVDGDGRMSLSNSLIVHVEQRPPTIDAWDAPIAEQWYSGDVYCHVSASDPDGDPVTVQFEYSLDSTDGMDGRWSQCYYPLSAPPFDCNWQSRPLDGIDSEVWLRVYAIDSNDSQSPILTRRIKIDNSVAGLTFSPHAGEFDQPLDTIPSITFDAPITNASLDGLFAFTTGGQPVPHSFAISADRTRVTLTPDAPLLGVTPYTIAIIGDLEPPLPRASATFTTIYGPPVSLRFVRSPQTGMAGRALGTIRVAVVDAQQNTVLVATNPITLHGRTASAIAGVAEFTDISTTLAGPLQLIASASGLADSAPLEIPVLPGPIHHFLLTGALPQLQAGTPAPITVTAYDEYDNIKTDYQGTPDFSSSDSRATLPGPYTYYLSDAGVHSYRPGPRFASLGPQTLTVNGASIDITITNRPPEAPIPIAEEFTGIRPSLRCEPFVDHDDAGLIATHWQIADDADFASIIWDSGDMPLQTTVQAAALTPWTDYYWRARVQDNFDWSPWSAPQQFRTAHAFPFFDDFSADLGWQGWERRDETLAYGPLPPFLAATPVDSPPIDCSGQDIVELHFQRWLDIEGNDWAQATLEVSPDGKTWTRFWSNPATAIDDSDWTPLRYDISSVAAGQPTVFIRFVIGPLVQAYPLEGWRIDDVQLLTGDPHLAAISFTGPDQPIEVGEVFSIEVSVEESSAEANGLLGASLDIDFPEANVSWEGHFRPNNIVKPPFDLLRSGTLISDRIDRLGGLTTAFGQGDGAPIPFATLNFRATHPGEASFFAESASAGFALASPVGQIGPWRVAAADPLVVTITPTTVQPLAHVSLLGQPIEVAMGNVFEVHVRVREVANSANGFLGGPIDVNFDPELVAAEAFDPAASIQAPYQDLGITSGSLLTARIDELGGATLTPGHGNGSDITYAILHFRAAALGDAVFSVTPGASGLALTTPVGQISVTRTDYGLPLTVHIVPGFVLDVIGGSDETGKYNHPAGRVVPISAAPPATGQIFDHWDGDIAHLADSANPETTVLMPAADVSVSAVYRPIDYSVLVNNGSGDTATAHYEDRIQLVADPAPTGQTFDHWAGDSQFLEAVDTETTTLVMPARNVTLTAVYRNIIYDLSVIDGSGSGQLIYQQRTSITADAPAIGMHFTGWIWTGEGQPVLAPASAATSVDMPPRDLQVTATYANTIYSLTVNQGSGDGNYIYQQQIAISADAPAVGKVFAGWQGDSQLLADSAAPDTTLTMAASNASVTATYAPFVGEVTVIGGAGDGNWTYGERIEIRADNPPVGHVFDQWTGDTAYLDAIDTPETFLTMPDSAVIITATYKAVFTLVVAKGEGTGTYAPGTAIPIAAIPSDDDGHFQGWLGHTDTLDRPEFENGVFIMPNAHAALVANFATPYDVDLVPGWNLIGVGRTIPNPANDPANADVIIGLIWGSTGERFFHIDSRAPDATNARGEPWHTPGFLTAGHGYWLYSPEGGRLVLR